MRLGRRRRVRGCARFRCFRVTCSAGVTTCFAASSQCVIAKVAITLAAEACFRRAGAARRRAAVGWPAGRLGDWSWLRCRIMVADAPGARGTDGTRAAIAGAVRLVARRRRTCGSGEEPTAVPSPAEPPPYRSAKSLAVKLALRRGKPARGRQSDTLFRPPGLWDATLPIRWLTPTAKKCRPLG